ncbi:MAG: OmpH family outer membrane protein [Paludibacteraceae bacterium]|nr:OmpH family outer membrane protein [Paludibacteraceae bacterium]
MFKKLIMLCLAAMPLLATAQSTVKLGHLDVQALFVSLPEAAEIDSTMKKVSMEYENELKRMQDEMARKAAEYEQNAAQWDETIKANRAEEIRTMQTRVQNYYQNAQQLLAKKQEQLQAPVRDKLKKAIDDVAKENGFLYVFDQQALIYKSESSIDITNLVLKKLGVNTGAKK